MAMTHGLRQLDGVANNPHVAMTALLHKLCLDTIQHTAAGNCVEASVQQVFFSIQSADLQDSPSAKAVAERHDACEADMPKDETALWDWLAALDDASRGALLAHCVSFGVNASVKRVIAMAVPTSPFTLSSVVSRRPTGSHALSGSTWSMRAGGRRSTIISAASPKAHELDRRDRAHHAEREIGLFKRQEAGGGLLCMLGMGHSLKEWSSMRRPSSVTCVLLCSLENSKPPSSSSIS